ncbi:hypothetical protein, partial [Rhizobium leguminosarum]|uniref:hypothetical protein n=1 Tax=Rhizobium leguminosarum TaxID=384 RepID=UPI001C944797
LDPLQVALAHRYQSHPQSPPSSNPGSVTFQLCRNRTLQLCGYMQKWRNLSYGTEIALVVLLFHWEPLLASDNQDRDKSSTRLPR